MNVSVTFHSMLFWIKNVASRLVTVLLYNKGKLMVGLRLQKTNLSYSYFCHLTKASHQISRVQCLSSVCSFFCLRIIVFIFVLSYKFDIYSCVCIRHFLLTTYIICKQGCYKARIKNNWKTTFSGMNVLLKWNTLKQIYIICIFSFKKWWRQRKELSFLF